MSAKNSAAIVGSLPLSKNNQNWFPRWIYRFASSQNKGRSVALVVSNETVLHFLRSLRDNQVPAWQRLQAARAVQCYRTNVLNSRSLYCGKLIRFSPQ